MYSKYPFPISMENIPRQKSFCCLSLRVGAVFTALIVILYSVIGLAECGAALGVLPREVIADDDQGTVVFGVVIATAVNHAVTFVLTAAMLVGALRESLPLIRPWIIWCSAQLVLLLLLFLLVSTMNVISHFAHASLVVYLVEFMFLMIRTYMLMLVASYYRELEESTDQTERLRNLINSDTWYSAA